MDDDSAADRALIARCFARNAGREIRNPRTDPNLAAWFPHLTCLLGKPVLYCDTSGLKQPIEFDVDCEVKLALTFDELL